MDLDVQPYLVSTFSLTKFLSSPKDQKWSRQRNEIFVGGGHLFLYSTESYWVPTHNIRQKATNNE